MSDLDGHAVSSVHDHPFVPRGDWFTVCGHAEGWEDHSRPLRICGLAEAAHVATTLTRSEESP